MKAKLDAWLSSRPPAVRRLAVRFPPGALVRATRDLQILAPGRLGVVEGYREDAHGVCVLVGHADDLEGPRAACDPAWIVVADPYPS